MKRILRLVCGHGGCKEWTIKDADDKIDYSRLYSIFGNGKWKCTRHDFPEEVLGLNNLKRVTSLISGKSKKYLDLEGMFWGESGFVYGKGWKAYADDFPEGTKIIITAEVILPKNNEDE